MNRTTSFGAPFSAFPTACGPGRSAPGATCVSGAEYDDVDEQHPIVIVIVWENEPALEHLRQMVARVEDWDVDRQAVLTKLKVTLMRSVRANTRVGRLVRRMRSLSASVVDGRDQCLDLNHDRRIWGMVSRVMVMPGDCEAHSH